MENNLKVRKKKDNLLVSLVYLSAIITVGLLVVIVGFIFIKGIAKISPNFLFADYSASGNGGILPTIIRSTEEALKTVPDTYREASLGLGATKFQTLYKVILPSAIPGILSGVILSIGRVIGESAAILLTAGTVAKMPLTVFDSARTLTVHAYLLTKETGDIQTACGVGLVLIVIVFALNTIAKLVAKKLNKANY